MKTISKKTVFAGLLAVAALAPTGVSAFDGNLPKLFFAASANFFSKVIIGLNDACADCCMARGDFKCSCSKSVAKAKTKDRFAGDGKCDSKWESTCPATEEPVIGWSRIFRCGDAFTIDWLVERNVFVRPVERNVFVRPVDGGKLTIDGKKLDPDNFACPRNGHKGACYDLHATNIVSDGIRVKTISSHVGSYYGCPIMEAKIAEREKKLFGVGDKDIQNARIDLQKKGTIKE